MQAGALAYEYLPAAQGVQAEAELPPAPAPKVPAAQGVQALALALLQVPGGHAAQAFAPTPAQVPAGHAVQADALLAPGAPLAVPAAQGTLSAVPPAQYPPAPHATQRTPASFQP
jgi:hypothetical protein